MTAPPRGLWHGLAGLVLVATVAAAVVAGTWQLTAERIEDNQRRFEERSLAAVLGGVAFDNLLQETRRELDAPALLGESPSPVWLALQEGRPVGLILRVTAPDGYNGRIRLLVGLSPNGELLGVETLAHRETPGLGDFIDDGRFGWMAQFPGLRLGDPPTEDWALARDGGRFDAVTGATVTSRAVVGALRSALLYFDAHREELLQPPAPPPAPTPGS